MIHKEQKELHLEDMDKLKTKELSILSNKVKLKRKQKNKNKRNDLLQYKKIVHIIIKNIYYIISSMGAIFQI
jgi:hypothetical protein